MPSFKISDEYNQQFILATQTDDENWLPSYNFDIEIRTKKVHIFSKRVWFDVRNITVFVSQLENLDATRTGSAQLLSFSDEQFLMQLKTISANGHIAVAIKYDDGNDLYDFGFREGLAIYFGIDSTQLYALRNYFMRAMMH